MPLHKKGENQQSYGGYYGSELNWDTRTTQGSELHPSSFQSDPPWDSACVGDVRIKRHTSHHCCRRSRFWFWIKLTRFPRATLSYSNVDALCWRCNTHANTNHWPSRRCTTYRSRDVFCLFANYDSTCSRQRC